MHLKNRYICIGGFNMKKLAFKIILLFLTLVVFTTGMGASVFNFCCGGYPIQIVKLQQITKGNYSCCKQFQEVAEPMDCRHPETNEESKCCKIKRHTVVLDLFYFRTEVSVPLVWVASVFGTVANNLSLGICKSKFKAQVKYFPEIPPPRDYLTLICILII